MAEIVPAKHLREETLEDLELRFNDAKKELFNLRVRSTTKELTDPNQIRHKRREIARIKTVMNEKKAQMADAQ